MQDNTNLPNRKSIRLPGYNYKSSGAYFVTICTGQRQPIFALPEFHSYLLDAWQALPERFPGVMLDEFVIMPDHIHFIIWLDATAKNAPSLGRVVGAYKSLTTVAWLKDNKAKGIECSEHLWQQKFYEHIIRNDPDLDYTRQYIRNNPMKVQEE